MKNSMFLFLVMFGLILTTGCQKEVIVVDGNSEVEDPNLDPDPDPEPNDQVLTRVMTDFGNGDRSQLNISYNSQGLPVEMTTTRQGSRTKTIIAYDGDDIQSIRVNGERQTTDVVFENGLPVEANTSNNGGGHFDRFFFFRNRMVVERFPAPSFPNPDVIFTYNFDDVGNIESREFQIVNPSFLAITDFKVGSELNPFRDMKFQAFFGTGRLISENVIVELTSESSIQMESTFETDQDGRVISELRSTATNPQIVIEYFYSEL